MRRKLLIFSLIALILILPISLIVLNNRSTVEAAWMDDAWLFRKAIAIPSHTTLETNVYVTVPTFDATDTTKFQADCGDLRFTKQNGEKLPYYVVSCSASAVIHVFFSSLPAGSTTYYMYYGNSAVANGFVSADFATAATGLGTQALATEEKSPAPIAYWKFDEGQGVTANDSTSVTGINGTIAGATWATEDQCVSGKCLQYSNTFINTNYVKVNNATSLTQSGDLSVSSWFKANSQPSSNSSYKVLVIEQGASGTSLKDQYTAAGYNVVVDTSVTTVGQVVAYSPNIVLCDEYAWGCTKQSLYNGLYDAGYNVVTKGNDTAAGIYPILTSHGAAYTNKTVAPDEKHAIGNGWSTSGNSGSDTGQYIDTINSAAISIARDTDTIVAVYLEEPNKGRWFHYQHLGTIDSTLFSNFNAFILRYNVVGKGKNYNLYIYNGNLYGFVNNQKLSGAITYNTWNHASLVYDKIGGNIYLYLNGKQLATAAYSTALDTDSLNISMGSLMKGFLDEVKIYPYARTAAQIKTDFTSKGSGSIKGTSVQMGSASKNSDALSNGLVGYWKMDESSTPSVDSSGNGNSGTWYSTTAATSGKYGNGAIFNGTSDYIEAADTPSLSPGNAFTFSTWIYQTGACTSDCIIFNKESEYEWRVVNGSVDYAIANTSPGWAWVSTGVTITPSTWTHVTLTYDSARMEIKAYKDGVLVSTRPNSTGTIGDGGNPLKLAARSGPSSFFGGKLDEVRIYSRALSATEVSTLYSWAPGPIVYYNLEDGSGTTTANDISGNGNSGTINGTVTNANWVNGKYGKAYNFNGTDTYVKTPGLNFIGSSSSEFTVSGWINPRVTAGTIFHNYYPTSGWSTGLVGFTGGKLSFYVHALGFVTETGTTPVNSWTYVSLTRDSSGNNKLYKNGVLVASNNGAYSASGGANEIGIGRFNADCCQFDSPGWFNGKIDEVKLYNYARSSKQITEDMNAGHPAGGSPVGSQLGYWKLDEGQGTTANNTVATVGNGTLRNTPAWSNAGKFGKALSLDGLNDYLEIPNSTAVKYTGGDMTFSIWVNRDSAEIDGNRIISKPWNGSGQYNYGLGTNADGTIYFSLVGATSWSTTTTDALPANAWTQLIVTIEGSSKAVNIYMNGKLIKSDTYTIVSWTPSSGDASLPIAIGTLYPYGDAWAGNVAYSFKGSIDEIKIYSSALTANEVKLDYNRGSAMVMGSTSTTSSGAADNSASGQYCIPGDSSSCVAPVGEWNFEEGTGTNANDTSGNGYVGAVTGTTWTNGQTGKALNFNGTSDKVQTSNPILTGTGDFTIEAWINRAPSSGVDYIAGNYGTSACSTGIEFYVNTTVLTTYIGASANGTTTLNANTWYHVVTTRSNGAVALYVNGKLESTTNLATSIGGVCNWAIGNGPNYTTEKFDGKVDGVKIFNYARTPAQISYDYNRGGPVGWWKMDECQGVVAHDSADPAAGGTMNDGTITIGATVPQTSAGTCTDGLSTSAWNNGKTGKYNASLNFDGVDDYVNIPDPGTNSIFDLTNNVTLSTWIKTNGTVTSWYAIINKNSHTAYGLLLNTGTGIPYFEYGLDGTGSNYTNCSASYRVDDSQWHHIATTYNGTIIKLYDNGKEFGSCNETRSINTTNDALSIGQWSGGGGVPFKGQIDDVRIYNYALTPAQVKTLFNGGAAIQFGP